MCYQAKGTGYEPDPSALEGGYLDMFGEPLNTVQDFLEGYAEDDEFQRTGTAPYVSAAMDPKCPLHGKTISIAELDAAYGQPLKVKVCDCGDAFRGRGTTRIDICCRWGVNPKTNQPYMNDDVVNGNLTLSLEETSA